MVNLKNFIPRRKYRERGQLKRREHLGLLEKQKDYKLRARDYKAKMQQLRTLRLQGALRNPDEFYFKMVRGKVKDGKVELSSEGKAEVDQVEYTRLLKEKNAGLVRLQESIVRNNRNRLLEQSHLISEANHNQIDIYVDSPAEMQGFDLADYYDTYPELLPYKSNLLTRKQLESQDIPVLEACGPVKEHYQELLEELDKEEQLRQVSNRLDYERRVLSKERRKTLCETEEGVRRHKFFRERKR